MPRSHGWLSLLLAPVTAALVWTALGLPGRASTGLVLRGDRVEQVIPASPAGRAGFLPGDRILQRPGSGLVRSNAILPSLEPDVPVGIAVARAGERLELRLVPERLPRSDFRLLAVLLMVAFGFVMLASVVWSERRDALTGTFFLLSLAFALLVSPHPRWPSPFAALLYQSAYAGITLFLPALCVHFFALFPESTRPRGAPGALVRGGYGAAALLYALTLASVFVGASEPSRREAFAAALDTAAALWFAAGLLVAIGLFARSFWAAGGGDARRRLRVALFGTLLGVAPLVAAILARTLAPGTPVPGERAAVVLTLLVPASFAWAIVVHRVFDLSVALRALAVVGALALGGVATLAASDRLAGVLGRPGADRLVAGALTLMAVGAASAGRLSSLLRPRGLSLAGPLAATESAGPRVAEPASRESLLESACDALARELRLGGCAALDFGNGPNPRLTVSGSLHPGPLGTGFEAALEGRDGVLAPDQLALSPDDRDTLDLAGVRWLVPLGRPPGAAVLLLGGRLAGSWLARREVREVERFADHLRVALENLDLRREASTHVAFGRALEEARSIQAHFLPRRAPAYPTLDCAAAAFSCESVGGDYYDFVETGGRDFTLAVGDAAGKGVPAALLLAGVQARFRSEARRGLGPSELLRALNRQLVQLEQPEKFVGLLCARVDVRRGRVGFANAGLTPPLIRRRDGRFEEVTAGGVLLGVRSDAAYRDCWMELARGDVAVLYTDGLTEARRGEELFGVERLAAVLGEHAGRRASEILAAVLREVRAFADQPLDDLTLVVLRQLADPPRRRVRAA